MAELATGGVLGESPPPPGSSAVRKARLGTRRWSGVHARGNGGGARRRRGPSRSVSDGGGRGVQRASFPNPLQKKLIRFKAGAHLAPHPARAFSFCAQSLEAHSVTPKKKEKHAEDPRPVSSSVILLGETCITLTLPPPLQITDQVLGLEKDARVRVRFNIECGCIRHPRQPPPRPKKGELYTIVHNGASVALGGSYPSRRGSCLRSPERLVGGGGPAHPPPPSPPPCGLIDGDPDNRLPTGGTLYLLGGASHFRRLWKPVSQSPPRGGSHSQFPYRINRDA